MPDELDQLLSTSDENAARDDRRPPLTQPEPSTRNLPQVASCQWQALPNEGFRPAGRTCCSIPAGTYRVQADEHGVYWQALHFVTDDLLELDDAASQRVLQGIRKFWESQHEYRARRIVYKRGVLLWGPAGSGKTALVTLLSRELVRNGGVVVFCGSPCLLADGLALFRRIERERPLIVVFEDIEEIIAHHGEHDILALLDGELQIGNVTNLATTNYPERLGARIANRPSRFDERIHIEMPSASAREKYLRHMLRNEDCTASLLPQWVADTQGFSIAHLRELCTAVFCLKQDYGETIARLRGLTIQPKALREFHRGLAGFGSVRSEPAIQHS